jgi:putative endonuclease
MGRSHRFGQRAEALTAEYLRARGWRIMDRNWRFHHKELDIVAERDGVVAFVEVKARGAGMWGHPLDAITVSKQRELATAARGWIARRGRRGQVYRFDAAVVVERPGRTTVEYFENAWVV